MAINATIVVAPRIAVATLELVEVQSYDHLPIAAFRAIPRAAGSPGAVLEGRNIVWSTSNSTVATVDQTGRVYAHADGSAVITATCEGISNTINLTVTGIVPPEVSYVVVLPATFNNTVGQTRQLAATAYDIGDAPIPGAAFTWGSSDTGVATVNSNGLVTMVAEGSVTITATSDGQSDTSAGTITAAVTPVVTSVVVTPSTITVEVGSTANLSASVRDQNSNNMPGETVTWSSSDTGVATVNSTGVVTGVADGSATITATSVTDNTKSGSSAATVEETVTPVVTTVVVTPSSATIADDGTQQFTASVRDQSNNNMPGETVTWASSDTDTATVNSSGLATAVADGSTVITATSVTDNTKSGTANLTVSSSSVLPPALTSAPNGFIYGTNFSDSGITTGQDVYDELMAIGQDTLPSSGRFSVITNDPTFGKVARLSLGEATNFWMNLTQTPDNAVATTRIRVIAKFNGITAIDPDTSNMPLLQFSRQTPDTAGAVARFFGATGRAQLGTTGAITFSEVIDPDDTVGQMALNGDWIEMILEQVNATGTNRVLNAYLNEYGTARDTTLTTGYDSATDGDDDFQWAGIFYSSSAVYNVGSSVDIALIEVLTPYVSSSLIPVADLGT